MTYTVWYDGLFLTTLYEGDDFAKATEVFNEYNEYFNGKLELFDENGKIYKRG